jgi:hypothetical protein
MGRNNFSIFRNPEISFIRFFLGKAAFHGEKLLFMGKAASPACRITVELHGGSRRRRGRAMVSWW